MHKMITCVPGNPNLSAARSKTDNGTNGSGGEDVEREERCSNARQAWRREVYAVEKRFLLSWTVTSNASDSHDAAIHAAGRESQWMKDHPGRVRGK